MAGTRRLLAEARELAADTEELIEQIADRSESHIVAAREKARQAVSRARSQISEMAQAGTARAQAAGRAGNDYVHDNPWRVIAGVAALALLAGALLTRR